MGELTIRRNRGFAPVRDLTAGRTGKSSAAAPAQKAEKNTGLTLSDTLQQRIDRSTESRVRESRRTLQTGEAVLDEVQDSLARMARLAQEAKQAGDGPDRAALQAELEQLRDEIGRMLGSASSGGTQLFLDEEVAVEDGSLLYAVIGETPADQAGLEQLWTALGLDGAASLAEVVAAAAGGNGDYLTALYLGAAIAGGVPPGTVSLEEAIEGLQLLMDKVAEGVPADQAIEMLTQGAFTGLSDLKAQVAGGTAPGLQALLLSLMQPAADSGSLSLTGSLPLLALLAEGTGQDLLTGLMTALQSAGVPLETAAGPGPEGSAPQTADGTAVLSDPAAGPAPTLALGKVMVTGQDLSGVSYDEAAGVLTVAGTGDVVIQGTDQGPQAVRIEGSGQVVLQNVTVSLLTAGPGGARVLSAGGAVLEQVLMQPGASLSLAGGPVQIGALRGDPSNTLRLAQGAVVSLGQGQEGQALTALAVPVVLEGPAVLSAQASAANGSAGDPAPFDLLWRSLLPGWSAATALSADGVKLSLSDSGLPAHLRLWLDRGDRGYPVHTLVMQGRDRAGQLKTRYAYLRWDQNTRTFQEISMYPNPFTITGGEAGRDWIYEEESHCLHILSDQVTAVSGGSGTDAEQLPFSGRILLADKIGALSLSLGGVDCQVSSGRAFDLGAGNQVSLILPDGTQDRFESGPGCAGISLGEGSSLTIDRTGPRDGDEPDGVLTAVGGSGGAGIGRDSGAARTSYSQIWIRGGTVLASGTGGGAGIGAGDHAAIGPIAVLGGRISASGGPGGGAGIGGGLGAPAGDITIRGGRIEASAAYHAAAIGAGVQGPCGDIHITGTARIVKAQGGDPGADIGACLFGSCGQVLISGGADIGMAQLRTRSGIPLQIGEDTMTLPQFRLSARSLGLDRLSLSTPEEAQAAGPVLEAGSRWVAQIQATYCALYDRIERGPFTPRRFHKGMMVRDSDAAGDLLREMSRSIPLFSQASRTHSRGDPEDVRQLLE